MDHTNSIWSEGCLNLLESRAEMLQGITSTVQQRLVLAPAGSLRINKHGKKGHQFYWRKDPKDKNGNYVQKTETELIHALAQKSYDQAVLRKAGKELKYLKKILPTYKRLEFQDPYITYPLIRKEIVDPLFITDELFVKAWLDETYDAYPFHEEDPVYYTTRKERMRSKSEVLIAERLHHYGVPYKYEKPMVLPNYGSARPDFICLRVHDRKEYVFEHLGRMDDENYVNKNLYKMKCYAGAGYTLGDNLLFTFESKEQPLSTEMLDMIIEKNLL